MKISIAVSPICAALLCASVSMQAAAQPAPQSRPAESNSAPAKNCSPAGLDARTRHVLKDEFGPSAKVFLSTTRVDDHVIDPFHEITFITRLEDEFSISLTDDEASRILNGTVQTAMDVVRAKHKDLPANACHADLNDVVL